MDNGYISRLIMDILVFGGSSAIIFTRILLTHQFSNGGRSKHKGRK